MTAIQKALVARITEYLASGGLFNPEMANHDAVRDLLIGCRDAIAALDAETPTTPADVDEEPVAWQFRSKGWSVDDKWSEWLWGRKPPERKFDPHDYEERPVYSATALERVVMERDTLREQINHFGQLHQEEQERNLDRAESAEAKLAEARKVIEPFAEVASEWDGEPESLHVFLEWNDENGPVPSLPVAEFRAARRFLEETK